MSKPKPTPPTELAPAEPNPREKFANLVARMAEEYMVASPLSVRVEEQRQHIDRVRLAFRALAARTPDLYRCDATSLGRVLALTVMTGLSPFGAHNECDIIVRTKRGKVDGQWRDVGHEATWQIGWRGYLALARRSGCVVKVSPVFDGDYFEYEEGLDPKLVHRPDLAAAPDFDALVCCYVTVHYPDGRKDFRVCPRGVILDRRNRSDGWQSFQKQAIKSTPWSTDPVAMAMKAAVRWAAQRGTLPLDELASYAQQADYDDGDERLDQSLPTPRALPEYLDEAPPTGSDEQALDALVPPEARAEREPGQEG